MHDAQVLPNLARAIKKEPKALPAGVTSIKIS